jgi:alpha-beta hydrolase superfamily lysophospholipase
MNLNAPDRSRLLHTLIILAIVLAAGPEVFAAVEMTTLLELLGATLFLVAFSAGARLLLSTLLRAAYDLVIPCSPRFVLSSDAPLRYKFMAATQIAISAFSWGAFMIVIGAFGKAIS